MNRPGATADRRRAESTAPRLHIAGPGDILIAGTEAASERPSQCQPNSLEEATAALRARKELAIRGAEQATQRQRARGKMTVRERLEALLDEGSFTEIGVLARHRASGFGLECQRPDTDGVVTGWGTIDGRKVCCACGIWVMPRMSSFVESLIGRASGSPIGCAKRARRFQTSARSSILPAW